MQGKKKKKQTGQKKEGKTNHAKEMEIEAKSKQWFCATAELFFFQHQTNWIRKQFIRQRQELCMENILLSIRVDN